MALSPEATKDWPKTYKDTCIFCGEQEMLIRRGRNRVWHPRYRRYVNGYYHITHHKCAEGERQKKAASAVMDRLNGWISEVR